MTHSDLAANHHAHHRGFAGVSGTIAALSMAYGRDSSARWAASLTDLTANDRLMDIGCGPGGPARFAAKRGAVVTAIDPAPVMLRVGKALSRTARITWLEGTAESLPLGDTSVDVAWALASVHHWQNLPAAVAEVRRVLSPDGRFVAMERLTAAGARGHSSHGWTEAQAQQFAELVASSFIRVEVLRNDGHIAVTARA